MAAKKSPTKTKPPAAAGTTPPDEGLTYSMHDVEGVAGELELTLRDGMNLLTGENGAAKTGATRALVAGSGGDQPLTVHDGAERGGVHGPGIVINVGARTTRNGQASVDLADHGRLHQLIEPDGKTAATRDKQRASALLEFVGRQVDQDLLLRMADGDEEVAGGVQLKGKDGASVSLVAAAVKRMAEAVARDWEAKATAARRLENEARGRVVDLGKQLDGYPRPDGSVADLEARVEEAIREHERLSKGAGIRAAREEERARWGDIGRRPPIEDVEERYVAKAEEVGRLEQALAEARQELQRILELGKTTRSQVEEWDRRAEALARPVDGPVGADVEAAERKLDDLRGDLDAARLYAEVDATKATMQERQAEVARFEATAERRRVVAANVARVLSQILQEENFGDLAIDKDEGLCYVNRATGLLEPFDRLSTGQRTRLVLTGIGCRKYPGRVMPVDPAYWSALQPSRQKELVEAALFDHIKLVSEMPTDRPGIRLVHLGVAWVSSELTAEQWVRRTLEGGAA